MKTITKIGAAAVSVSAAVTLIGSIMIAESSAHGRRQTLEEAWAWQQAHYDTSFYEPLEKTEYTISSYDGYELHACFVKNPDAGDRFVILTHGYTDNRFGSLKYMKMYLDLGFHCLIYDLRDHGENARTFCTYSVREAQDLIAVIDDTYERYGKHIILGLHGESLGAATTVMSLMYYPDVEFAVADCGFADIENVLEGVVAYQHLPKFLVKTASAAAKIRYGYSFSEMRPIDALAGNRVPILFIHGEDDTFILPENSKRMKEATDGYAEVRLIRGAGHAKAMLTDPESYAAYVKEFLENEEVGVL